MKIITQLHYLKRLMKKKKKNKDKNEKLIILKMFIKNTLFFTKIVIK